MDKAVSHRTLGLALAAVIFVVDQALKFWVTGPLGLVQEGQSIKLLPIFDITLVHNLGVSLGLFRADSDTLRWILVAATTGVAAFVASWLWRERNRQDVLGLGLILGGAAGNILDRARLGYVVDYADLHFGTFRPFLVFNLADAAITVGVLIVLARAFLVRDPKTETGQVAAENENA